MFVIFRIKKTINDGGIIIDFWNYRSPLYFVNAYRDNYLQNNAYIYGKNVKFRLKFRQSYPLFGTFLDLNILSMP